MENYQKNTGNLSNLFAFYKYRKNQYYLTMTEENDNKLSLMSEELKTGVELIKSNINKIEDVRIQMQGLKEQGFKVDESIESLTQQKEEYSDYMESIERKMSELIAEVQSRSSEIKNF